MEDLFIYFYFYFFSLPAGLNLVMEASFVDA